VVDNSSQAGNPLKRRPNRVGRNRCAVNRASPLLCLVELEALLNASKVSSLPSPSGRFASAESQYRLSSHRSPAVLARAIPQVGNAKGCGRSFRSAPSVTNDR